MGSDTGTVFQLTFRGGFIIGLTSGESKASAVSYASERVFGGTGSLEATSVKDGSASAQIPNCPNRCKSGKIHRDGLRYNKNNSVIQRWKCTCCGERFSDKALKSPQGLVNSCQICAEEAKNLEPVQLHGKTHPFCSGDAKLTAETKGLLTQFYAYLEKEAYSAESDYVDKVKHLAILGADLKDPENVKNVISKMTFKDRKTGEIRKVKNGTKLFTCYAYDAFLKMLKISWERPHYSQEDFEPFVPDETELDALINAANSKRLAAFLQCLKETFGDPGEVLRIKWLDVDTNNKTICIRYPVKNHLPRTLSVSNRLLSMIDALPRKEERIFATDYSAMLVSYVKMRKKTADVHKNQRLLAIDFTAFRTWAGTNIAYHTNGNVLTVKKLLGHKQIKNTMKYIGRIEFKDSDLETTSATTVEDILRLGREGWQEFSVVKINNVEHHCFKKPKRFSNYAIHS